MKRQPSPIKDVVSNLIAELADQKKEGGAQVLEAWGRAVGKKFAPHTKVVALKSGRLVVNVDGSSWLYELSLRQRKILKRLSRLTGKQKDKVKELRLRIGEVRG